MLSTFTFLFCLFVKLLLLLLLLLLLWRQRFWWRPPPPYSASYRVVWWQGSGLEKSWFKKKTKKIGFKKI